MSAELLTVEDFAPHVGTLFVIADPAFEAILSEATPLLVHPGGAFRQPFSLLFHVADQTVLPQSIYQLQHADMGALDIFLVPIACDRSGVTYEAAFN